MSNSESDSEREPEFINLADIKLQYRFNADDIKRLPYRIRGNPRERYFYLDQVNELAAELGLKPTKRRLLVSEKRHISRLQKRRNAAAEARMAVAEFKFESLMLGTGSMKLPLEVLHVIMERMIDSFEIELDGISGLVNQVAQVALSCPDFFIAAKYGFEYVKRHHIKYQLPHGIDWNQIIVAPMSLKASELKEACTIFDLSVSGTKPGTFIY